jgi:KaiC domain protein
MSEDDDWFERAVGASESDATDEGGETDDAPDAEAEPEPEAEDGTGVEVETDGTVDDAPDFEAEFEADDAPDAEDDSDADDAPDADEGAFDDFEAEFGADDGDDGADSDDDGGDSPFDQDFADAFQNAPDPGEGGGAQAGFGGGAGPDPEQGGPGGSGGPGGFPGGESLEEQEEEFESDIDRVDLGIEGLDAMILGGVPERSLISIVGSAGTGKTTFGLQFLNQALTDGKRAVYISLEESTERIFNSAAEKGWSFREYSEEGRLAVVHLDPIEMANSLTSIRSDLPDLVDEFGADRLVLDSVSLLEMMYDHPSDRRSEVFQFSRSLKEAGVTTLVTSEADSDNPYSSRYGIIEYLADAVFVLQYVRPSDFQETRLALEIQKIRDASHSRETKPYELTSEGLSVYRQANIF